jgi:hypothetical protein
MAKTIRQAYAPVDLHRKADGSVWPDDIPELTADEALKAARRLYRWATGADLSTVYDSVQITSGNRHTWHRWTNTAGYYRSWTLFLNPSRGWRRLVHDLSHAWFRSAGGTGKPHSKDHARFEVRMAREVVRRGWLQGKLRAREQSEEAPEAPAPKGRAPIDYGKKLAAVEAKIRRAKARLSKLNRQRAYYEGRKTCAES